MEVAPNLANTDWYTSGVMCAGQAERVRESLYKLLSQSTAVWVNLILAARAIKGAYIAYIPKTKTTNTIKCGHNVVLVGVIVRTRTGARARRSINQILLLSLDERAVSAVIVVVAVAFNGIVIDAMAWRANTLDASADSGVCRAAEKF